MRQNRGMRWEVVKKFEAGQMRYKTEAKNPINRRMHALAGFARNTYGMNIKGRNVGGPSTAAGPPRLGASWRSVKHGAATRRNSRRSRRQTRRTNN